MSKIHLGNKKVDGPRTMKNEKGVVLVLALVMMLCLTIMVLASTQSSIFEIKLAGNDLTKSQAFQSSESGWQIARTKLETLDTAPTSPSWTATENMTDPIPFEAFVSHDLNADGSVKTFAGKPIYIIESHGYQQQAHQITEVKLALRPSLDPPAALYSKSNVTVKGASTFIKGLDRCGGTGTDKPGIETTASTITENGVVPADNIAGLPRTRPGSSTNYPITGTIDYLKGYATRYTYTADQTLSGVDFGALQAGATQQDPTTPLSAPNVVYYDMNGQTLKLTGGSHGAGILMVNGNLEVDGGFNWYGVIIVTGIVKFTGGGGKNITGGVISGGSSSVDIDVAGDLTILYCSGVKDFLNNKVPPTKLLSWQHKF
jgi:PilX N-terminal